MTADHDDALFDAVALAGCAGSGDETAAKAILANMDATAVACVLAKLLAALVADNAEGFAVCPAHFRTWALDTGSRRR